MNRYIREGIISSDRVDDLFLGYPLACEFYHRLLHVTDDFGRCEASAALLRGKCFPKISDHLPVEMVEQWLQQVASVGLVLLYTDGGKRFLQTYDPPREPKAKKSKYPAPQQDANVCLRVFEHVRAFSSILAYTNTIPNSVPNTNSNPNPMPNTKSGGAAATAAVSAENPGGAVATTSQGSSEIEGTVTAASGRCDVREGMPTPAEAAQKLAELQVELGRMAGVKKGAA